MKGRKKLPTSLHILHGNPSKKSLDTGEPKPKGTMPDMPGHLDTVAQEEWERMAGILNDMGVLTEIDGTVFAEYCQAYSTWVSVSEEITRQRKVRVKFIQDVRLIFGDDEADLIAPDILLVGPLDKQSQNPLFVIQRQVMELIKAFCVEHGMTPSSRARISLKKEETKDPYESFKKAKPQNG